MPFETPHAESVLDASSGDRYPPPAMRAWMNGWLSICLGCALSACPSSFTLEDASTDATLDGGVPDSAFDAGRDSRPTDTRPDDGLFRVGTWNLQEFPRSGSTISLAAGIIDEQELDLVGIQEITDPEAFDELAASLGYEAIISFGSDGFTRVGFLYDPDVVRVSEIERLFGRDRFTQPRSPIKAVVEVLDDSGEVVFDFIFVVVHLKARGDPESRERRAAAIVQLDDWMREQLEGPEQDIMVVGDYNDALDDAPDTNVYGPFLDAPADYLFLTEELVEAGDFTFPFFESFIDHILVTTDALDEYGADGQTEVVHYERELPNYFRDLSDHLPVISTFALPRGR